MDTGRGNFAEISEFRAKQIKDVFAMQGRDLSGIFTKGEILELKGSRFRVEKIKTRSLRLLLLPAKGGEEIA